MIERWGPLFDADPYYNPNQTLDVIAPSRAHESFAYPPRSLKPRVAKIDCHGYLVGPIESSLMPRG